jgi:ABC-2 type transport system ATP-binding protein
MLRVEGLAKRFRDRGGERTVLEGLDLRIDGGESVAVFGPNGAGKSTLLRCVAGLIAPDQGVVALSSTREGARSRISYLFDGPRALRPRLTVRENLRYFQAALGIADRRFIDDATAHAQALGLADIDRPLQLLSRGSQQKVNIAIGLAADPELLICDEPSSFLDEAAAGALAAGIRAQMARGASVLVATHNVRFAEAVGARELALDGGRLRAFDRRAGNANTIYAIEFFDLESRDSFVSRHELEQEDGEVASVVSSASSILIPYMEKGLIRKVVAQ